MNFFQKRWQASRFYRGEQAGNEPLVLNHRRIFILPTPRGLGFGALMAVLMTMAFVYNNNLVYLLAFLLAGIFLVSILYCYKSLSGLVVQAGECRPVFAGEPVAVTLLVDNRAATDRKQLGIAGQSSDLTVKAGAGAAVTVFEPTCMRGWQEIGTITLYSTFPSGLFKAWSPLRFNLKVLVYPAPSPEPWPFPETAGESSCSRPDEGGLNRDGDDFYGLQEYRSGDSLKRIHWKAFAKGHGLYSKQYGGEKAEHLRLDYNDLPDLGIEERLSRLCRWIIDAEKAGLSFGFSLPGVQLGPDSGQRFTRQCLEALALF